MDELNSCNYGIYMCIYIWDLYVYIYIYVCVCGSIEYCIYRLVQASGTTYDGVGGGMLTFM